MHTNCKPTKAPFGVLIYTQNRKRWTGVTKMTLIKRICAAFGGWKPETSEAEQFPERRYVFSPSAESSAEEITFWIELCNSDPIFSTGFAS